MTRTDGRRAGSVAAAIVGVLVLAACSGGEPAAPTPSPTSPAAGPTSPTPVPSPSSPPASPSPTPAATPSPTPTPSPTASPVAPLQGLALEPVAAGLVQPLDVAVRPGDGAVFAVEQQGTIRRVAADGTPVDVPMLDVGDRMEIHGIEQGLLGMAFHPDHPRDPRVFVFHSLPDNDNVLVSYELSDDPERLDPDSREVLLTIDKEPDKVRHNGGAVRFGPDGLLYVSIGDAARASVNGQDPATLPGSILRLDVDGGDPYAIPPGNPFADGGTVGDGVTGAPEVWWFGLRNPWRFDIDAATGTAWVADVGQERLEEVNVVPLDEGGLNFGWPAMEGDQPFYDDPPVSDAVMPILTVAHDETGRGCSITGGPVYRGAAIPELDGHYLYADWCNGWIRSLRRDGSEVVDQQDWSDQLDVAMVATFGVDAAGEVLVVDWDAGTISRIVPVR